MRKIDSTNVALKHALLKAIDKKLGKEKILFDYLDESWIHDFGNT